MANLKTQFFGLELKSPVIASSSSMTADLNQIKKLAKAGAGAIVLKSIFEEEIDTQLQEELTKSRDLEPDAEYLDYFDYIIKDENLKDYTNLIKQAKDAVDVPIVASVSCISASDWVLFVQKLAEAGADALELNLFLLPADVYKTSFQNEQFYFETIKKVLEVVSIPVSIKISHYFSNLSNVVKKLSETGVAGITLFNRFYSPDIDIRNEMVIGADVLSHDNDYLLPLRWTGILSSKISCPLSATTGIHAGETVIKFLLAGASAVQVASVLYNGGAEMITQFNEQLAEWMDDKAYTKINDFKGKLAISPKHVAVYERAQFMKYFSVKRH
ncbi:dihydroorotate dehydrogenase-like protein [uncultured Sunxiuqinia sp.]|uniref:dihydroorotate dehydrogenase-like protein n=1 Tax=uncultured Sunxiuqinia sp. TaxID=1573825 RepID=UPI002AA9211C|nr:dihydroorotate dehydrogenase-like protein [uncultured Sunxiuqinia sp.]